MSTTKRSRCLQQWAWLCLLRAVLLGVGAAAQPPTATMGDFGDAPDHLFANYASVDPLQQANFPSARDLDEVPGYVMHHLPQERVLLGEGVTLEEDAKLVDKDEDDGWVPGSFKPCQPARFLLKVTLPEGAPQGPIYLNALFDWNHDGRWLSASDCPADIAVLPPPASQGQQAAVPAGYLGTSAPEWGIQNLRLDLPPYELEPGFSGDILLPPMLTGALPGEMWIRFTVTVEPVDEQGFMPFALGGGGWDGRGDFLFGESEDYFACLLVSDGPPIAGCPQALPDLVGLGADVPGSDGATGTADTTDVPPTTPTAQNATPLADLRLAKSVSDKRPNVGDIISYVITVTNDGPDPASNVTVKDPLPAALSTVSSAANAGLYDGSRLWVVGDLGVGQSATLQVTAQVNQIGTHVNVAQVNSADQPDPDSTPANDNPAEDDQASVEIIVTNLFSDLAVTKSANVNPVALGSDITWTLTVTNNGPFDATNALLLDPLPAGLTLVSAAPSQGSCDSVINCNFGTLPVGASATVTLQATVTSAFVGSTLPNTASVSSDNKDPDPGSDSATTTVGVDRQSDLSVTKTDSADPVLAGEALTWTITVSNAGPADAGNVQLSDPLPAGVSLTSATPSQGSCSGTATIACALGTLANGANATVTVQVLVNSAFAGSSLSNTATVSSDNSDPVPGNNTDSETTTVDSEVDVAIVKTVSPATAVAGQDTVTWTLDVTNNGPSDAADVIVSDPLPAGLTHVGSSSSVGSCSGSSTVTCNLGTLANGASAQITIQTSVNASATGTITDTATVTTTTPETNLANNVDSDAITVNAQADLAIVKSDSPDPVIAGDNLAYTLAVTNNGPSDAANVSVSDPLPANTTLVSATGTGWTCSGITTVTCTRASLAVGAAPNITVTVTVSASYSSSTISNTATVSSSTTDPVPGNNSDSQDTAVNTQADLSIAKSDSPDPALAGNNLTYTLNVSNAGSSNAASVSVSDPLPANTTLVSATGTGWSCSGTTTVTCTGATLAVGPAPAITVTVTITGGFSGTLNNTVTVSSATTDPMPGNNSDTENTTVDPGVDLSIAKGDNPDPVIAGNQLTYTLNVSNAGPGTANNVSVSDPLPSGTTLVSATGTGWSCSGTTTVTCNLSGSLGVASANPITVIVTVGAGFSGSTITNTATVSTSNIDTDPANDSATEPTAVNKEADLAIVKSDSPDPVIAGSNLTYTLTVTNNGPSDAQSVSVSDPLPSGLSLVNASGTGWNCTGSTSTSVNCTRSSLGVASAPAVTVTTTVDPSLTASPISNTATVNATTTDPAPGNNSATEPTTLNTSADLAITKSDSPDPVLAGSNITYTLTVTNNGPSDAQGVTVSDPLPANTTFVSATPSQGSCDAAINCALGPIANGASATITLVVTANAGFSGTVNNTATVSSATPDPDVANDSASEPTTVDAGLDLSITKTGTPDPVIAGTQITWTIMVSNAGPADATNVTVTDTLPGNISDTSASGTGWTCSGASTITCTRPTLAAATTAPDITITATVDPGFTGALSNSTSVTSNNVDTNPANNSANSSTTVNPQADLALTKADSPDPVIAGDQLTWTLNVTNSGPSTAASLSVTDALPAGVTFQSASGNGWSCSGTTPVTCTRATLAPGATAPITITANTDPSLANLSTLNNSATVSSATPDPTPGNETGNSSTTVNTRADLIVSKSSSISTVRAGEQFSYFITVFNNGPSDAQNVQVTDTLPTPVLFQAVTTDQGSCPTTPAVGNTGTVICNLGTVPAGGFVFITLQVSVDSSFTGSSVDNSATATSDTSDPASGDNTTNVTTNVTQVADISLGLNDNPTQVRAGEQLTYTITVINNGPSDAQNVTMANPVPADVTIISGPTIIQAPLGSSCTSGSTINCNFGTLPNQNTAQIQYTVLVDQAYPTNSLPNSASASTTTTDTQPGNNSDTTATTVSRVSDLSVDSLTDSQDPVTVGQQFSYTVTVSNAGPSQSADATVTINLASGLAFVSSTSTQGSCNASGQVVTCALGAFNSGSSATITITVSASTTGTKITNASISTSASTDPTASNNSKVQTTAVN